MKAILKQLAALAASLSLLYAVILVLSLLVDRGQGPRGRIDSGLAGTTLYMTEPKYVFMNRAALRKDKPRVILVGASNTVIGLKPRELQPLLPTTEIDNLSIGGSNMTEVGQIIDLALAEESATGRQDTTFVIGMWYGMFTTDKVRWNTPDRTRGDTDLDLERYRYGFYRRTSTGPVPLLPARDLSAEIAFIRPSLLIDRGLRLTGKWLSARLGLEGPERTDADRNAAVLTEKEKAAALDYWHEQLQTDKDIPDEQFDVLEKTVERATQAGSKVVLVDLPLPKWHETRSPFYPSYQEHRARLLGQIADLPNVRYVDMTDADSDNDFSDEVHPKPKVTKLWAQRVATALERDATLGPGAMAANGSRNEVRQ